MLAFLARRRVLLWPAVLALAALGAGFLSPRPYDDGGLGSLSFGLINTVGLPFVAAASFVARRLGPGRAELIWPLAVPLGLVYFVAADWVVQRVARRRGTAGNRSLVEPLSSRAKRGTWSAGSGAVRIRQPVESVPEQALDPRSPNAHDPVSQPASRSGVHRRRPD